MSVAYGAYANATAAHPDKAFATLRARAALAGIAVHQSENDRGNTVFVVTRWHLTRELPDLAAVEAWLDCVEGRAR